MRWLVVDNHDSYTHNLVQLLAVVTGSEPDVVSDADVTPGELDLTPYAGIIVSPGPGHPSRARDFARAADVLARSEVPVLGVCLGMQGIALAAGALVDAAPRPRHGHVETVRHTGDALFAGVPEFFPATRYHSFRVAEPLPPQLEPIAWAADGVLMGVRHRTRPQVGVQFHPESIASGYGRRVIENFVVQCGGRREDRAPARERVRGAGAARVLTRVLDVAVDAEAAFSALHATSRSAFWFDSTSRGAGSGRFSFLGEGSRVLPDGAGVLARLEAELRVRDVEGSAELPFDFAGGVVGWAGYELRAECGFPTGRVDDAPVARWLVCERFVAIDHDTGRTWLVARVDDDGEQMRAREWLRRCGSVLIGLTPPAPPRPVGAVRRVGLRPGYRAAVEAAQRALAAGDSYEVCLTTEVRVAADDVGDGEPFEVYRRLRRANPAPYGAYLRVDDVVVVSSSPERFLRVHPDGRVETRPVKGTAPRSSDPTDLANDPKTRAENLMVVDLLRNDLGRVCEPGSVEVPELMAVETLATLHQLVTTVTGRLRPEVSAIDCLRSCFPPGSMTGAPKSRTTEIIDALEQRARGIYSGTIGWFSTTGAADLSVVIRTAVLVDGEWRVGAGGAVVLDSDPDAEVEEVLLKLRAPLAALGYGPVLASTGCRS